MLTLRTIIVVSLGILGAAFVLGMALYAVGAYLTQFIRFG